MKKKHNELYKSTIFDANNIHRTNDSPIIIIIDIIFVKKKTKV